MSSVTVKVLYFGKGTLGGIGGPPFQTDESVNNEIKLNDIHVTTMK